MPAIPIIAAVAAIAGAAASVIGGNQSRAAARHANDLQEQAADDQRAQNAQDSAAAARQQYREDRIKRARILQSSDNSGTQNGSGEIGALGSLQTQYTTNQGNLQGGYERGVDIGNLKSQANESLFQGNQDASFMQGIGSIFSAVGSVGTMYQKATLAQTKIPGTTKQE